MQQGDAVVQQLVTQNRCCKVKLYGRIEQWPDNPTLQLLTHPAARTWTTL
jgi:hypothetical protein